MQYVNYIWHMEVWTNSSNLNFPAVYSKYIKNHSFMFYFSEVLKALSVNAMERV